MKNNLNKDIFPKRINLRLRGFDYSSPGAYFVTICTHNKQCLLGNVENGTMHLNIFGEIVKECWLDIPNHYEGISNDIFVVMPNHIHGIIIITGDCGRSGSKPAPTGRPPLSEIVRAFKTYSSKRINGQRNSQVQSEWQRGYYEHVIRSENELKEIGNYITYNPSKWSNDTENPNKFGF